jgi:hypothetical protein
VASTTLGAGSCSLLLGSEVQAFQDGWDTLGEQLTDLLIDDQLPVRNAIGVIETNCSMS